MPVLLLFILYKIRISDTRIDFNGAKIQFFKKQRKNMPINQSQLIKKTLTIIGHTPIHPLYLPIKEVQQEEKKNLIRKKIHYI